MSLVSVMMIDASKQMLKISKGASNNERGILSEMDRMSSNSQFERPVSALSNNRQEINQGGTRPTGGTGLARSRKMNNNIFDLSSNALQAEKQFSQQALNIDNLLNEDINLDYGSRAKSPFDRVQSSQSNFNNQSHFDQ